jgi:hypothetical protein
MPIPLFSGRFFSVQIGPLTRVVDCIIVPGLWSVTLWRLAGCAADQRRTSSATNGCYLVVQQQHLTQDVMAQDVVDYIVFNYILGFLAIMKSFYRCNALLVSLQIGGYDADADILQRLQCSSIHLNAGLGVCT